ncbi:TPA: hypothetical protein N0F65_009699 [Lagenidium giganteum]|uniref:B box-type domain-containing protein n=1 Tax=Lagenidium giganteum TaxID=4803 RepID=A0AAV2YGU4_9STRA|nr:TPA: hypothetical protein N0F65_009699 [Lagenidium giganteum]
MSDVEAATSTMTEPSAAERLKSVSRMRALSALLEDEDMDDENAALAVLHRPVDDDATAMDVDNEPVDESTCVECRAHESELFCEQCQDYFCELCFGGQHRKGNRSRHTFQPRIKPEPGAPATTNTAPTPAVDSDDEDVDASDSESESDSEGYGFTQAPDKPKALPASTASSNAKTGAGSVLERAKYIPVRLTYEERKRLRLLEAALCVSNYTGKMDTPTLMAPAKRLRLQLQEICGFLTGLAVSLEYNVGQSLLNEKNFVELEDLYQEIFELGRRYKIMNPEKMRGEYGKLMYLLQDAVSSDVKDLLGFSCYRKIRTVYDVLAEANALGVLTDSKIDTATMVVAPEGKSRMQIQRHIKHKEQAIREISEKYSNSRIDRDGICQCLYSIADNNYHLYFERDPIDRMVQLLTEHFEPDSAAEGCSLSIVSGNDGARLSHSHSRQYNYVLQSMTLWREIAHDMFRLWCLTDDDLLADGTKYALSDTGQGMHRVQPAPRVSRAMHVLLHSTQRKLDTWVGSSVIHLGDKNVPNALMFIDKYTQVGHILRPIVKTVDAVDTLAAKSPGLKQYIDKTFGGPKALKRTILTDFFREAFDGSGADNFFEAGSCIDGRLTSAWNWCSNLHKKQFYPVFKLAGFVGFDGKFG